MAGTFKQATFGGFDKKSVLDYIESMNAKFHAVEMDYRSRFQAFEEAQNSQLAHIADLERQLADSQAKLETVASRLESEREQAKSTYDQLKQVAERYAALQQQYAQMEQEQKAHTEQCRQLQFKAESLEYKSQKYDEVTGQIGNMLLEARRDADQIIEEAKTHAAHIERQAREDMSGFYRELASFSGDAENLHKSIEELVTVLNDRVDVMQAVIAQVENRFQFGNEREFGDEQQPEKESDAAQVDSNPQTHDIADTSSDDGYVPSGAQPFAAGTVQQTDGPENSTGTVTAFFDRSL